MNIPAVEPRRAPARCARVVSGFCSELQGGTYVRQIPGCYTAIQHVTHEGYRKVCEGSVRELQRATGCDVREVDFGVLRSVLECHVRRARHDCNV